MHIHDAMTPNPILISPSTTAQQAAEIMAKEDIGCLIIGEADRLDGIITDRDLALRVVAKGKNMGDPVQDFMTKNVLTCKLHDAVEDVTREMLDKRVLRMAVVDDNGKLCGIVSHGDLARASLLTSGQEALSEGVTDLAAQKSVNQEEAA